MNKALATATILVPLKLLPALTALTEVMGGAMNRDSEWQDKWNKARTDYFLACRELLGSGVVRASDSPDSSVGAP